MPPVDECAPAEYDGDKKGEILMKNNISKHLAQARWGSIALIVLGLVLLLFPDFGSSTVAVILAWVLMIGGSAGLLIGVLSWPAFGFGTMIGSGLVLAAGIYILRHPLSLASILGVLLGVLLTAQGLGALGDALRLRRGGGLWVPGLVLSILTMVFGLILIFSPLTSSRIVMTVVGLVLIVFGAGNLYTHFKAGSCTDSGSDKGRIIDADE